MLDIRIPGLDLGRYQKKRDNYFRVPLNFQIIPPDSKKLYLEFDNFNDKSGTIPLLCNLWDFHYTVSLYYDLNTVAQYNPDKRKV